VPEVDDPFMRRSTIRGQKEKEKEKEKEKQQQKEKAFNPHIENNPVIEEQLQNQKTIDVKEMIDSFYSGGSKRPTVTEYRILTFLTHCEESFFILKMSTSTKSFLA
jgi:hypothetical protein